MTAPDRVSATEVPRSREVAEPGGAPTHEDLRQALHALLVNEGVDCRGEDMACSRVAAGLIERLPALAARVASPAPPVDTESLAVRIEQMRDEYRQRERYEAASPRRYSEEAAHHDAAEITYGAVADALTIALRSSASPPRDTEESPRG